MILYLVRLVVQIESNDYSLFNGKMVGVRFGVVVDLRRPPLARMVCNRQKEMFGLRRRNYKRRFCDELGYHDQKVSTARLKYSRPNC
jgi:hypothetical protein